MTVSLDVLLGTLIFVLPGFIAVGTYVGLGRFLTARPDLTRGTFVLLSLALSIPILLAFNEAAPHLGVTLIRVIVVPTAKSQYVASHFLFSLSLLYAICAGLGALVAIGFNRWCVWRRKVHRITLETSRREVWTEVMASRTQAPYVLAVLEKSAYHGVLKRATTDDEDPYVFITKPDFVPLDGSQRPDFQHRSSLHVDGILLKKVDIQSFWFIS